MPSKLYDRLDAAALVRIARVVPEVSERGVTLAVSAITYLLFVILTLPWLYRYIYFPIIMLLCIVPALFLSRRADSQAIARFIHTHWLSFPKAVTAIHFGPYGYDTAVRGIRAGDLVCPRDEYHRVRQEYRSVGNRSDPPPPVPYRLLLATYIIDGNQQVLAFAGGTSIVCSPRKPAIVGEHSQSAAPKLTSKYDVMEIATTLSEIIKLLINHDSAESLVNIYANERDRSPETVAQALITARYWNMIKPVSVPISYDGAAPDSQETDVLITLTQTGEDWYRSSAEYQPLQRKQPRISGLLRQGSSSPSINIEHFAGILNYGKNIRGHHTSAVHQTYISDSAILGCLKEILGLQQIAWSDPRLADVRMLIEEALAKKDPKLPGLQQALTKLRNVCGEVLIRILSNGAYSALMYIIHRVC